jgi:serine protease Do
MSLALLVLGAAPHTARAQESESSAIAHAKELSLAFRRAAEKVQPAVVTVISFYDPENDPRLQRFRELFDEPRVPRGTPRPRPVPPGGEQPQGEEDEGRNNDELDDSNRNVGSGIITGNSGWILTNNHVVDGARDVIVRLPDGSEVKAKEIRQDQMSDLAIVRIETEAQLPPAQLGDSEKMEIGDWVIAIGCPFELESTVSAGIISGKGRGIVNIRRGQLLQTDAAINPGNSGGPLVNLDGEVVGINTAIATVSGTYQGVGFAIPSTRAAWVMSELIERGSVRRAYLGIKIGELTAEAAAKLKLGARSGVWVVEVLPDAPAAAAGVKTDDVIVEFAGLAVHSPGSLQEVVETKEIGSQQKVTVMRDGQRITFDVTMKALPDTERPAIPEPQQP